MNDTYIQYVLRLLFALGVGGLIGIEREVKGKPAGMRTNMLMCMGSCLMMILSIEVLARDGRLGDPTRIASQIMTGIGFIGAGTIIHSRLSVAGLTSAATLWFVAAIGLVAGWGDYFLAATATVLIIGTLTILSGVERHIATRQRRHILQFQYPIGAPGMKKVKSLISGTGIHAEDISLQREGKSVVVYLEYLAPDSKHERMVAGLRNIDDVDLLLDY
jgi:putative Mg2+ transporter-C (MgtC) family protein